MTRRSATPLYRKLGIKPGHSVCILNAPRDYAPVLPDDVTAASLDQGPHDVIQFFTRERAELESTLASLGDQMKPSCGLWICWPKRASRVTSDLSEQLVRQVALPTGLVDNKVCAIDDTWSGLRLVIRRALR